MLQVCAYPVNEIDVGSETYGVALGVYPMKLDDFLEFLWREMRDLVVLWQVMKRGDLTALSSATPDR